MDTNMNRNDIKMRILPVWFSNVATTHVAVTMPVMTHLVNDHEIQNYPSGIVVLPPESGLMRFLFPRNSPDPELLSIVLEKTGYTETELLGFERSLDGDAYYINYPGIKNIPFTF